MAGEQTRWIRSDRARMPVILRHLNDLNLLGQSPDTINCRRLALRRIESALEMPLLMASADDLAAWRAALTVAPNTIVSYVSHVRQFYRWAISEGLREDDPTEGLRVPRYSRRLPRPISEPDLMAAITDAPPRIRPWLVLAGWAGLRAKEIAYLRRENIIDTARPPVLLIASDATKGCTERIVPLCAYALRELRAAGLPASGWVFARHDGMSGPNKPWMISHLCNQYLHELGIQASLHKLRHRFGTQTYQASRDLRAVQELLGHAHPQTTAGYAAYANASAESAVNSLPVPSLTQKVAMQA